MNEAISSKHVDEFDPQKPTGVLEFFCLVEFSSIPDQNH